MKKTTILIADDHQLFIDGLEAIIKDIKDFELIGSAQNGMEALKLIREKIPDLAILDISMPEMDGIELAKKLREEVPYIKIMMVSMVLEFGVIKTLLDLDIKGYVLKNASKQQLIEALKTIGKGQKYFSPEVKDTFFSRSSELETTRDIILTRREKEVLKEISLGHSARETAEVLMIGQATVETHRKHLISKLGVKNTAEMIRFAILNKLID